MKKLFISQMACSIMVMLAVFMSSCKQDLTIQPTPISSVEQVKNDKIVSLDLQGVKLENGILSFDSLETLKTVRDKLDKTNFVSYKAWCLSNGFESLALLKDEIFTEYGIVDTDAKLEVFTSKNKELLVFNSDGSISFKNTATDMLRFLNKNSMVKIGKSLYLFDEKGEIIIQDGDISKMIRAIPERKNENGIKIYPIEQVQVRSACSTDNYSGLTYAFSDPARRANLRTTLFWRVYTPDNNVTISAEAAWVIETNAQRRLFRIWYDYTTEQSVNYDIMVEVIEPVPTAIRGANIVDRQYGIHIEEVHTMIVSKVVASFAGIPTQQFDTRVRPKFNFIDITYGNRGGVDIPMHCS